MAGWAELNYTRALGNDSLNFPPSPYDFSYPFDFSF